MLARGLPGFQFVNNIPDFPKTLGNSATVAGVVRKRLRAPLELRLCLASFRGMMDFVFKPSLRLARDAPVAAQARSRCPPSRRDIRRGQRACCRASVSRELRRQVDAVDPASIRTREVPRWPANAAANIENPAVLRKCNPLSLLTSGGQAPRMEMLDRSRDFRGELLRIMSQFSQCGVDPRKHARSRPMRLNIRRPFSHGVLSRSIQRNYAQLAFI